MLCPRSIKKLSMAKPDAPPHAGIRASMGAADGEVPGLPCCQVWEPQKGEEAKPNKGGRVPRASGIYCPILLTSLLSRLPIGPCWPAYLLPGFVR